MGEEKTVAPADQAAIDAKAALDQKELESRVAEFNKELLPILGKYELGLGATAFVTPTGTIGARPIMFDARKKEGATTGESAPAPENKLAEA